jgi:3-phenylpropionate/cinnamic acid dioxygenase small subunit
MDAVTELPLLKRGPEYFSLKMDVEDFLYREAELLDQRKFQEWFQLIAEDIVYFMPMKRNVKFGMHAEREDTRAGEGISWFDEDRWTLGKRIDQILTGVHFAEEPLSRVCRLVTNVVILDATPSLSTASEVTVKSRFLIYQNRGEHEQYTFVGKRKDILRRSGGDWQIARREITLDQSVLLAKNLSIFF